MNDYLRLPSLMLALLAMTILGTPVEASKCTSAKLKAAGKKASCKLGVYAKAASKNAAVDTAKLGKCEAKFSAAFTKAESANDCVAPTGDEGAIEGKVDSFVTDVNAELASGTSTTTTLSATTTTTGGCASDADCTPSGNQCEPAICQAGVCVTTNLPPGSACNQNGGTVCDGNGTCVQCNTDSDCPPATPFCSGGDCVQCNISAECPAASCNGNNFTPASTCNANSCSSPAPTVCSGATPVCSASIGCVQCNTNSDCPPATPICMAGICVP